MTPEHFEQSGLVNILYGWAFVAENDTIYGFALYHPLFDLERTGYVPGGYSRNRISPRKGIRKLLFDRLIEEAKKKFNHIIWRCWNGMNPINFYRKYKADFDGEWLNCSIYV